MENSAVKNKKGDLTGGSIGKSLLFFFLPILAGTWFQQLYNAVDAAIVGRYVGHEALAAVSCIVAVMYLILRLGDKAGCDPDKLYVNIVKARSNNNSEDNDINDKEEN